MSISNTFEYYPSLLNKVQQLNKLLKLMIL